MLFNLTRMALELYHEEGFRSMKSDALQGQSSSRSVWSATEYVSEDLTLFSRTALFIDLNPARNATVGLGIHYRIYELEYLYHFRFKMIKWCSSFWKQRKARLPDCIRILSVRRNAAPA